MIGYCIRIGIVLLGVFLSVTGPPPTARAQAAIAHPTVLTLQSPQTLPVGERPMVIARLTAGNGRPVVGQPIELHLNGRLLRRVTTSGDGTASFRIDRDLEIGVHPVQVVFEGTASLSPASGSTSINVEPATLQIKTLPALQGVRLMVDGQVFESDEQGLINMTFVRGGTRRLEVLPWDGAGSDSKIEFQRWNDMVFTPARDIRIPATKSLEVGFAISHKVNLQFVDPLGSPIESQRISSVVLKSSHGETYTIKPSEQPWLRANRILRRLHAIEDAKVRYFVQSVMMDGSNLVNEGQQRFLVNPSSQTQIELLVFSTRFTARDALFGFPLGSGIHLEYPDGRTTYFPFEADAELKLNALARGMYRASVAGAAGLAPPTPLALSRDQDVPLLVISYLDIGVVVSFLGAIALSLFYMGRPHILSFFRLGAYRRNKRQPTGFASRGNGTTKRINQAEHLEAPM